MYSIHKPTLSAAYLSFGGFTPGPLTFEYSALYSFASQSRSVASNMDRPPIRKEMAGMVRLLLRDAGGNPDVVERFPVTQAPWGYKPLSKTNRALVGFSGGKDSVAAALKLKERGMDVTLVYVSGINQTTPDEAYAAESAAALKMPLVFVQAKRFGKNDTASNPFRNHIIYAILIDMTRSLGASTVTLGTLYEESSATLAYLRNWSDTLEVTEELKRMAEALIPGLTVETRLLRSETESLLTILKTGEEIPFISCGLNNKDYLRGRIEKKYGVSLDKSTCGSCWKCQHRYLTYSMAGVVKLPEPFLKFCRSALIARAREIHPGLSTDDALDYYMDIELFKNGAMP